MPLNAGRAGFAAIQWRIRRRRCVYEPANALEPLNVRNRDRPRRSRVRRRCDGERRTYRDIRYPIGIACTWEASSLDTVQPVKRPMTTRPRATLPWSYGYPVRRTGRAPTGASLCPTTRRPRGALRSSAAPVAPGPIVTVVGSEGRGLSRIVRETCDVIDGRGDGVAPRRCRGGGRAVRDGKPTSRGLNRARVSQARACFRRRSRSAPTRSM